MASIGLSILSATVPKAFAEWSAEEYKVSRSSFSPANPGGFTDTKGHPTY